MSVLRMVLLHHKDSEDDERIKKYNELEQVIMRKVCVLGQGVEMEHTASLLHDDVVDESDERRGMESVPK